VNLSPHTTTHLTPGRTPEGLAYLLQPPIGGLALPRVEVTSSLLAWYCAQGTTYPSSTTLRLFTPVLRLFTL
jgi:hypothetical protein